MICSLAFDLCCFRGLLFVCVFDVLFDMCCCCLLFVA